MITKLSNINYKVVYSHVYEVLKYHETYIDYSKIFTFIDDDFFDELVKDDHYRCMLMNIACYLCSSIYKSSHISMYLFSHTIKTLANVIENVKYFQYNLNAFSKNSKEQNLIMIKAFDKIIEFYYKNMSASPLQNIFQFLLTTFSIHVQNICYNDIIKFAIENEFNNVVDFIEKFQNFKNSKTIQI